MSDEKKEKVESFIESAVVVKAAKQSTEKVVGLSIAEKESSQIGVSKPIEVAFPTTTTTATFHETQSLKPQQHQQQETALKIEVKQNLH
jgi:hypothetical protein